PDGNGLRDTTGLALALKEGFSARMGDATWIFGAYGTVPEQWQADEDGQLQYGSIHPGAKQALAAMRGWLSEGLVDYEAELMNETTAVESFLRGEAGIIAGPHWMADWPLGDMPEAGGRPTVQAIRIPAGPDGTAARRGSLPRSGAILLNKDLKRPELFFAYQNYPFDYYALRQGELRYGMAENYDWSSIDGQPSTDPKRIPGGYVRVANYSLTFDGARIPSMWRESGQSDTMTTLLSQADASWVDAYLGAPTPTYREAGELLRKLEAE